MAGMSSEGKARIEALLQRASEDPEFRHSLLNNTDEALQSTDLTDDEKASVRDMRRVKLEEIGVDVRPYRAMLRDNGAKKEM